MRIPCSESSLWCFKRATYDPMVDKYYLNRMNKIDWNGNNFRKLSHESKLRYSSQFFKKVIKQYTVNNRYCFPPDTSRIYKRIHNRVPFIAQKKYCNSDHDKLASIKLVRDSNNNNNNRNKLTAHNKNNNINSACVVHDIRPVSSQHNIDASEIQQHQSTNPLTLTAQSLNTHNSLMSYFTTISHQSINYQVYREYGFRLHNQSRSYADQSQLIQSYIAYCITFDQTFDDLKSQKHFVCPSTSNPSFANIAKYIACLRLFRLQFPTSHERHTLLNSLDWIQLQAHFDAVVRVGLTPILSFTIPAISSVIFSTFTKYPTITPVSDNTNYNNNSNTMHALFNSIISKHAPVSITSSNINISHNKVNAVSTSNNNVAERAILSDNRVSSSIPHQQSDKERSRKLLYSEENEKKVSSSTAIASSSNNTNINKTYHFNNNSNNSDSNSNNVTSNINRKFDSYNCVLLHDQLINKSNSHNNNICVSSHFLSPLPTNPLPPLTQTAEITPLDLPNNDAQLYSNNSSSNNNSDQSDQSIATFNINDQLFLHSIASVKQNLLTQISLSNNSSTISHSVNSSRINIFNSNSSSSYSSDNSSASSLVTDSSDLATDTRLVSAIANISSNLNNQINALNTLNNSNNRNHISAQLTQYKTYPIETTYSTSFSCPIAHDRNSILHSSNNSIIPDANSLAASVATVVSYFSYISVPFHRIKLSDYQGIVF